MVPEHEVHHGSFVGEIIQKSNKKDIERVKYHLFGKNQPTDNELAEIAGAHKDEVVSFRVNGDNLEIDIIHKDYLALRELDISSGLIVINESIRKLNPNIKNLGIDTLKKQILMGSKFGVKSIRMIAARDEKMNGYNTWALYGFNGLIRRDVLLTKIPEGTFKEIHDLLNRDKGKYIDVQELVNSKNGRIFWESYGDTFIGKFDLTKDSENIKLLYNYMQRKLARGV